MGQAVLIYDGDCSMCRSRALLLMRRALSRGRLEILPYRSGVRARRFPEISDEACRRAMHLVLPEGRVLVGADAVPELLRRMHGSGWMASLLSAPGIRSVGGWVYAWMARRRMRIVCEGAGAG